MIVIMRRRSGAFPPAVSELEDRVVPSHSSPARGLSVVVSGLQPRQQVLNARQQPVIAEVNQSFDSFANDYSQARATYFASIQNVANPSTATTDAFRLYTQERVSLLAQQLIGSFLQSPQANARANGQQSTLKLLINSKIIGPQNQAPAGTLAKELVVSIPAPGTSQATASLYSLTQDNAIEAARVSVINGVNVLKNGDFGNKTPNRQNQH
jgi:hypothetical protein